MDLCVLWGQRGAAFSVVILLTFKLQFKSHLFTFNC